MDKHCGTQKMPFSNSISNSDTRLEFTVAVKKITIFHFDISKSAKASNFQKISVNGSEALFRSTGGRPFTSLVFMLRPHAIDILFRVPQARSIYILEKDRKKG